MKTLYVLSACPGCGKSTYAHKIKNENKNCFIISSDEIRKNLTGSYQDFSKDKLLWEEFEHKVIEYSNIDDVTVVLDAAIDSDELRKKYYKLGQNYDKRILVVFKKSLKEVLKNNKDRKEEKWVPEDVVIKMFNRFEMPSKEIVDLFDEYIYIDYFF